MKNDMERFITHKMEVSISYSFRTEVQKTDYLWKV